MPWLLLLTVKSLPLLLFPAAASSTTAPAPAHLEAAAGSAAPARDGGAELAAAHRGVQEFPQAAGLPAEEPDLLCHPLHASGDVLVVVEGDAENLLGLAVRSSSATSAEGLDDVLEVGRGAEQEEEDDVVEVEAHLHLAGGDPQLDVTS